MNALAIAGKEFDDAIRSRSLWVMGVIFVGSLAAVTLGYAMITPRPRSMTLLVYVVELTKWLVPIAALVAGYDAVVGERESGTLRLLFGFPYARWEILFGKVLGRFAAVIAPVTAGLVVSLLLSVVLYDRILAGEYAILLVTTALLAGAFVSLAVAVSALSQSAVRVVAMVVGAFVGFLFLWDLVPATVHVLVVGSAPGAQVPPAWFFLIERLNPVEGFLAVLTATYPGLAATVPSDSPFYLSGWFAIVVLLVWIVAPIAGAYARFRAVDLA